jgi:hypothetical protein
MFRGATHDPLFGDLADRSCRAAATVAVDFGGVLHQQSGRLSDEDESPSLRGSE